MIFVKLFLSTLIVAICFLSVQGIFWWSAPPEPLAHYTTGGRAILGVVVAGSLFGLWTLWFRDASARAQRT